MNQVKFFKLCLPQILLDPYLNNSTHMFQFYIARNKWAKAKNVIIEFIR